MKIKLLLLYCLLCCIEGFASFPTIEKGNLFKRYINPGLGLYWRYSQLLQCDSMFGGQNYLKLYRADSLGNTELYLGLIREDTINGKIYFKADTNIAEHLIIDYSLNIGDSIYNYYTQSMQYVDTVYYQYIFGKTRKHIKLQNDEYIEGIGSYLHGLCPDTILTGGWVSQPEGLDKIPVQCFPLGISERLTEIKFYPNPAEDYIIIERSQTENKTIRYKIFDLNGKCIQDGAIQNQRISISDLTAGIYLLEYYIESGEPQFVKLFKK